MYYCRRLLTSSFKASKQSARPRIFLKPDKESNRVQSDLRTYKRRRHRHRRICANCEQILDSRTIKCPRCDRFTLTLAHLLAFAALGTLAVLALFKWLEYF